MPRHVIAGSPRRGPRWRRRTLVLGGAASLLVIAVIAATSAFSDRAASSEPSTPASRAPSGHCGTPSGCTSTPLTVLATAPAAGATDVATSSTITVEFSTDVRPTTTTPTISPEITGSWFTMGRTMTFSPAAPFVPGVEYTLAIPGGAGGVVADDGEVLAASDTVPFTVGPGSVTRLQQLLAQLGYLPLTYDDPLPAPEPKDMALPQPGSFNWRWSGLPAQLTSQWSPGTVGEITKAAVTSFEAQNGLGWDGNAGPEVWTALLADVAEAKQDTQPVSYVLVTPSLPEHLTVWVNGVLTLSNIPCNTGVPGAPTVPGTYAVFEHVKVSNMKGTDVTGTHYDVTVPWVSYFDNAQALHGYPRAAYGFPQSNGCVEMPITTAGTLWPDTPIGTIVTVE
ncbi:MAG: Ig-like domain-containing protein [Acidimicrobiales bacterium]